MPQLEHTDEIHASLFLHHLTGFSREQKIALLRIFGSAHAAVLQGVDGWRDAVVITPEESILLQKNWAETKRLVDDEWYLLEKTHTHVLLEHAGFYPARLREIANPPFLLYAQGTWSRLDEVAIALVGSRRCSYYGEKMSRRLATELAERGVATVSGLARGVDTNVHEGSISAGGQTWAVIGSGLARLYPPENKKLAERVAQGGVVLSEFPMLTTPLPGNFPRRNRIIAGLSVGTVVIEGDDKSGALITARLAAEQGRDVFALPGPVTSRLSHAPHRLIKSGAKLVETVEDILEEIPGFELYAPQTPAIETENNLSELSSRTLEYIGGTTLLKEVLMQKLNIPDSVFTELILDLELKGWVKTGPGGVVSRA